MTLNVPYPEDIKKREAEAVANVSFDRIVKAIPSLEAAELRRLRDKIDQKLPQFKLKDLDLEVEMVQQLQVAKDLQDETLSDMDTPANQKAQVLNATASAIQQLVKMQVDLQRDEQLKRMESALLKAVATLTPETQSVFFDTYQQLAIAEGVDVDG